MNWDAIAAIGQAVSALALVFVVIQVSHARNELRRGARQDRLEGNRETMLTLATNPQLASVIGRLRESAGYPQTPFIEYGVASGLTDGEARQLWAYVSAGWQTIQGSIESVDLFSPGLREDLDLRIRSLYSGNGVQEKWYELSKGTLNSEAVRYVERVLTRPS